MDPQDAGRVESEATAEAGAETEGAEAGGQVEETTPSGESEAGDEGDETPFRIEDVPEEFQPHAERLERQFKAALTRARQADREQYSKADEWLALAEKLDDPETVEEALNELAEKYGYEPNASAEPAPGESPDESELTPEQLALKQEVDALKAAEAERVRARQLEIIRTHVDEGLEKLADDEGNVDPNAEQLATYAALAQRGEDGLPNVTAAIELVQALEASVIERFIKSKRGETPPDLSGSSGVSQVDTSTEAGRLKASEAIAARHLSAAS